MAVLPSRQRTAGRVRSSSQKWSSFMGAGPGPITRQFSTRNGDVFDDPHRLTLLGELVRRQVAERAVWPALIVVDPPRLDLQLRISHRPELMHVQTLIPQPAVERFNESIFDRFAWPDEVQLDPAPRRYAQSSSARD